jgi:hypothetical protein
MLPAEDLALSLRYVLEDLLDTHTGRVGNTEYAEAVVQYLDVLLEGSDLEAIISNYGEDALQKTLNDERLLKEASQEAFASFNQKQAEAVYQWLEHSRAWPEMHWYLRDFDAAISYWRRRATQ